jgi:hypothetical protein
MSEEPDRLIFNSEANAIGSKFAPLYKRFYHAEIIQRD